MKHKTLVVATRQNWRVIELQRSWSGPVERSLGVNLPEEPQEGNLWWTSQEHYARLAVSGLTLPFLAPDPKWLETLPEDLTRRNINFYTYKKARMLDPLPAGYWKPATMKIPAFTAAQYGRLPHLTPEDIYENLLVQHSETVTWVKETRCLIVNNEVIYSSDYLRNRKTWEPEWINTRNPDLEDWLEEQITYRNIGSLPPTCMIDVGLTAQGNYTIVEANPTWCSSWYSIPSHCVVDALLYAIDWENHYPEHAYKPDPALMAAAARKRKLVKPYQILAMSEEEAAEKNK